ncbi:MAG: hypothetical protein KAI25_14285 [Hyphomicrobiaceae bacterium]|nr:hypothetical protein [Hyphomicrobiaceae bacterium]
MSFVESVIEYEGKLGWELEAEVAVLWTFTHRGGIGFEGSELDTVEPALFKAADISRQRIEGLGASFSKGLKIHGRVCCRPSLISKRCIGSCSPCVSLFPEHEPPHSRFFGPYFLSLR